MKWLYLWLVLFQAATANAVDIEVFVDRALTVSPVSGYNIIVYDLSAISAYIQERSPSFAGRNVEEAKALARRWYNSEAAKRLRSKSETMHKPLQRATQYQLSKFPAIVFENGKYVIYGTRNINQAIRDYHDYKKQVSNEQSG